MRRWLHQLCSSGALAAVMGMSVGASLAPLHAFAAATSAYDATAAATRSEYGTKVAQCRKLSVAARPNCMKAAKAQARAVLGHAYADAVSAAKAGYSRAAAKCKPMNRIEHHRCLKAARAERAMALGRAEEIRSAPLAMGMN